LLATIIVVSSKIAKERGKERKEAEGTALFTDERERIVHFAWEFDPI